MFSGVSQWRSETGSCGSCDCLSVGFWIVRFLFKNSCGAKAALQNSIPTSRGGNLNSSGLSHATTASPKPYLRASWRAGNAVVGRENAGWTILNSGHSCPCQNCSQGPPSEQAGRGSLLNRPSCPPDEPIGQVT